MVKSSSRDKNKSSEPINTESLEDKELNLSLTTDSDTKDKSKYPVQTESSIIPETDQELIDSLVQGNETVIIKRQGAKDITKKEAKTIINKISRVKDVSERTVTKAIATLFQRGAANAGAPDSMGVDVTCPTTKITTEITRYDIVMAIQQVVDHKNIRKLAECLAPEFISANLQLLKLNPMLDLKGDLANRINLKLRLRKEDALSREEEICCATYAQWMPNLNDLANSKRLKGLLEEDLNARKKRQGKAKKTQQTKQNPKGK